MKCISKIILPFVLIINFFGCSHSQLFSQKRYAGKPFQEKIQMIPGKVQCELYDQGGEGIAYHDSDSVNNGSGRLNPANGTILNEFRMAEGVDISYTKSNEIDNSPYNLVEPEMEQFYVGWTEPGEWINYTVMVTRSGTYEIGLMYTASGNGSISISFDGKPVSGELQVASTRSDQEPVPWRQWHHWNRIESLGVVKLKKGIHILRLNTVSNGNMNYDYLDFKLISKK